MRNRDGVSEHGATGRWRRRRRCWACPMAPGGCGWRVAPRRWPCPLAMRLGTLLMPPQRIRPWPDRIPALLRPAPLAPPDSLEEGASRVGSAGPFTAAQRRRV